MRTTWRRLAAGLTLAATVTLTGLATAAPASADTTWGTPPTGTSTTVGPVTADTSTSSTGTATVGVTVSPLDTTWG